MGKTKKFKDTIHGYIEIPDIIVKEVIDTALFQRLRYVEQTSMRPLYPAARHDRFIHSLGVYYLGSQAFRYFRRNAENVFVEYDEIPDKKWWNKQELLFQIACLLHDCAHAPFSHTLEDLYMLQKVSLEKEQFGCKKGTNLAKLDYELLNECDKMDGVFKRDFLSDKASPIDLKGVGAPHEKMSALCVVKEFKEAICTIVNELIGEEKCEVVDEDFVFVVRMIIGCQYSNTNEDFKSLKNCIISMLNSTSIDVDGLDYIVRDAYMSGIDNFSIDYQRLLASFTIVPVRTYENYKIENKIINGIWLKGGKFNDVLVKKGKLEGKMTIQGIAADEFELINEEPRYMENAKVLNTNISSSVQIKTMRKGTILLNESCKIWGKFNGIIQKASRVETKILENTLENGRLEFVLGYEKNSLSIIQSTVEARNHEYLWVYTHPKVLYNSNYLQLKLLYNAARFLQCHCNSKKKDGCGKKFSECTSCDYMDSSILEEDMILYILGFNTFLDNKENVSYPVLLDNGFRFFRTCDDDLNALFKRIRLENLYREAPLDSFEVDFDDFFSRNHRRALWKSFVEYDIFMQEYDEDKTLRELCRKAITKTNIYEKGYGTLSKQEAEIFEKYGMRDVLIISASVKTKQLNPNDTFIVFKEQALRLYDVFSKEILKEKLSKEFYYLYARMDKDLDDARIRNLIAELEEIEV